MRFRLVVYLTHQDNKYEAEERYEYLGDRDAIWHLWFTFAKTLQFPHVEVYSLDGRKMEPEKGLCHMSDYSV